MVVRGGRAGPICQAIISSILVFVSINNKTGCALTDKPLTYSETNFSADINVYASTLYTSWLVLALRSHEGDTSSRSGIPTKCGLDA